MYTTQIILTHGFVILAPISGDTMSHFWYRDENLHHTTSYNFDIWFCYALTDIWLHDDIYRLQRYDYTDTDTT